MFKIFCTSNSMISPIIYVYRTSKLVSKFGKSNIFFSCSPTVTSFEKILQLESFGRIYYRPTMKFSMTESLINSLVFRNIHWNLIDYS